MPRFADDPVAWLRWIDVLLDRDPEGVRGVPACEPWSDGEGHEWRVVATAEGPEVRPGLENPFLVHGPLPRITALQVSPTLIRAELSIRDWREVRDVAPGIVRVRHLGTAMLTRTELPHLGIERITDGTWQLASSRWTPRAAPGADDEAVGRIPEPAGARGDHPQH